MCAAAAARYARARHTGGRALIVGTRRGRSAARAPEKNVSGQADQGGQPEEEGHLEPGAVDAESPLQEEHQDPRADQIAQRWKARLCPDVGPGSPRIPSRNHEEDDRQRQFHRILVRRAGTEMA